MALTMGRIGIEKFFDKIVLFNLLKKTKYHPLVKNCIFHYEFEFIHPFADGNGRIGRLWQTLILTKK